MYDDLTAIEERLAAAVAELDPAVLDGPDALVALERACRITKLATTATMLLARRVHETDAWKPSGTASAAHLLANLAGCSLGDAMALLGTAKKMAGLPKTDDAARRGKLSGKQASEVSKGAAADPAAEDELLDLAGHASTAELTEESRRRRHAAAGDDQRRHARIKANRALLRFADDDGSAVMRWRHLPEVGAELDAILSDYVDEEFADARRQGRREQRCAYAADALVAALRDAAAFRNGESIDDGAGGGDGVGDTVGDPDDLEPVPLRGTDDDPSTAAATDEHRPRCPDRPTPDERRPGARTDRPPGRPPDGPPPEPARPNRRTRRRAGERSGRRRSRRRGADAKVIVRIDHAALVRGHTEPGEICEIAGIGAVPVASVAELLDDAFLAAVVVKGRDVHTVAHLGRQPTAYQQTALQADGIRCAVLGCPNVHRLERDHREEWARTHHTRLDELDWLCPHHHHLKTHEGYRLVPGSGPRALLAPDEQRTRSTAAPTAGRPAPAAGTSPRIRTDRPAEARGTPRRSHPPAEALTLDL